MSTRVRYIPDAAGVGESLQLIRLKDTDFAVMFDGNPVITSTKMNFSYPQESSLQKQASNSNTSLYILSFGKKGLLRFPKRQRPFIFSGSDVNEISTAHSLPICFQRYPSDKRKDRADYNRQSPVSSGAQIQALRKTSNRKSSLSHPARGWNNRTPEASRSNIFTLLSRKRPGCSSLFATKKRPCIMPLHSKGVYLGLSGHRITGDNPLCIQFGRPASRPALEIEKDQHPQPNYPYNPPGFMRNSFSLSVKQYRSSGDDLWLASLPADRPCHALANQRRAWRPDRSEPGFEAGEELCRYTAKWKQDFPGRNISYPGRILPEPYRGDHCS